MDGVFVQSYITDGQRGLFYSCLNYAPLNYSCRNGYEDLFWPTCFFLFSLMPRTYMTINSILIMLGWHSDRFPFFCFSGVVLGVLSQYRGASFILFFVSRGDTGIERKWERNKSGSQGRKWNKRSGQKYSGGRVEVASIDLLVCDSMMITW